MEKPCKVWKIVDENNVSYGIKIYSEMNKICVYRIVEWMPLACACSLEEFVNKTDKYNMQRLIKMLMGVEVLFAVRKAVYTLIKSKKNGYKYRT